MGPVTSQSTEEYRPKIKVPGFVIELMKADHLSAQDVGDEQPVACPANHANVAYSTELVRVGVLASTPDAVSECVYAQAG